MKDPDPRPAPALTHLDSDGEATMVEVGDKDVTSRRAVAQGVLRCSPRGYELLAGRPPHDFRNRALHEATADLLQKSVTQLRTRRDDIPADLSTDLAPRLASDISPHFAADSDASRSPSHGLLLPLL